MTDPAGQRARLERARHALQRCYVWCAVVAVGALVLMTVGRDVESGWVVLAVDAALLGAVIVGKRSFDRELKRLGR